MNNTIITIGREYGSGGHEVGIKLAKKLNIPFYDKALTELLSEKSEFAQEFLEKNEEKVDILNLPIITGQTLIPDYQQSFSDKIFIDQSNLIKTLAQKGSCVFVGRCADYVLKDYNVINIFIYASLDSRIARKQKLLKENEGKDLEYSQMNKHIIKIDKMRKSYYEYYTDKKWGNKNSYDLCISTDKIGISGAVETISSFISSL